MADRGVSSQAGFLDDSALDAARRDPDTVVYEWQETRVKPLPMEQVRTIIDQARSRFFEERRANPDRSDEEIRAIIKEDSEEMKSFADTTHQRIFKLVVNRDTKESVFRVIAQGIAIQQQAEEGKMDDDEVKVRMSAAVLEHAKSKSE